MLARVAVVSTGWLLCHLLAAKSSSM